MEVLPNLLVTGFTEFSGAPVNPTEAMVRQFQQVSPPSAELCQFRAYILDVDYATIGMQLGAIAESFEPDIALHFGLAPLATGFRLEHFGRNIASSSKPDNTGRIQDGPLMTGGADHYESTLPRDEITDALSEAELPASLDDQVGDYLCNAAFYLSRSGTCGAFRPKMSGFIHVPQLPEDDGGVPGDGARLPLADLVRGAEIAIETCLSVWNEKRAAS